MVQCVAAIYYDIRYGKKVLQDYSLADDDVEEMLELTVLLLLLCNLLTLLLLLMMQGGEPIPK